MKLLNDLKNMFFKRKKQNNQTTETTDTREFTGAELKYFRVYFGITQVQFAYDFGISQSHVSNMELGRRKVNIDSVVKALKDFYNEY